MSPAATPATDHHIIGSEGTALTLATAASMEGDAVIKHLGSGADGLSSADAAERLRRIGPNVLGVRRVRAITVLIRQLRNPILLLLIGAALVSALTGGGSSAIIIGVIVALSVGLGFLNEYRAEAAMSALRSQIRHLSEVVRDGRTHQLAVGDLVPGDLVVLRIGGIVPADLRLVAAELLECDEGVLTGESLPVVKSTAATTSEAPGDLVGCAYMGTVVSQGSGQGVVVATGGRTAFGAIASGLGEAPAQSAFEVGLSRFSRFLFLVAGLLTLFIFVANVALSRPLIEALLFSLAIAVGIAPEMMPAIVTVSLSSGSRALMAKHVMVKRLVAIEDLGNIDLLFTDKTGTLTDGNITFARAVDPAGADSETPLVLGLVCNEATVTSEGSSGGNALDQALWASVTDRSGETATRVTHFITRQHLPFDHDRQLGSVLVDDSSGSTLIVVKGAPEAVLARCIEPPDSAHEVMNRLFAEGARVVAVAQRAAPDMTALTGEDEQRLTLMGFLTFTDRPKVDAGSSIAQLQHLGVEVKIITGDNGQVAVTLCREIGMSVAGVLTGAEVEALNDDALGAAMAATTIFARISPGQKSRIITVARHTGRDVAFLGDGVNDAVALHHADVGISVDSGTDVAKDAADVVLLTKDLSVLAEGVMEGRRIFANTMKYVLMTTSSNFGNMFSAAFASVFLNFLPMLPSQILLNNLLYNSGQLAIPTDRVDPEVLARPAAWDIAFIRRFMTVFGPISSIFDFATFGVMLTILHAGHAEFRTGWFVESLATQTLVVYVIRTRRVPSFTSRPSLPMLVVPIGAALVGAVLPYTGLAHLLGFTPLPTTFFLLLFAMVVVYLVLVELAKTRFYQSVSSKPPRAGLSKAKGRERHLRRRVAFFVHEARPTPLRDRWPQSGSNPSLT